MTKYANARIGRLAQSGGAVRVTIASNVAALCG